MSRVCGYGIVFAGFSCNLVEFVKINDTVLRAVDILVGGVVKISYGYFNVSADEACLREA